MQTENPFNNVNKYKGASFIPLPSTIKSSHIQSTPGVCFALTMEWLRSIFVTGGGQSFFDGLNNSQFIQHLIETQVNIFINPNEWISPSFSKSIGALAKNYSFSIANMLGENALNKMDHLELISKKNTSVPISLFFMKKDLQSTNGHVICFAQNEKGVFVIFDSNFGEIRFDYNANFDDNNLIDKKFDIKKEWNGVDDRCGDFVDTPENALRNLMSFYSNSYSMFRIIYLVRGENYS